MGPISFFILKNAGVRLNHANISNFTIVKLFSLRTSFKPPTLGQNYVRRSCDLGPDAKKQVRFGQPRISTNRQNLKKSETVTGTIPSFANGFLHGFLHVHQTSKRTASPNHPSIQMPFILHKQAKGDGGEGESYFIPHLNPSRFGLIRRNTEYERKPEGTRNRDGTTQNKAKEYCKSKSNHHHPKTHEIYFERMLLLPPFLHPLHPKVFHLHALK